MIFQIYVLTYDRIPAICVGEIISPWQIPKLTTDHRLIILITVMDATVMSTVVRVKHDNSKLFNSLTSSQGAPLATAL